MKNIGIICPEISGHLNPMTTLGRELHRRGHRVAVIASVEAGRKATSAGLGFLPIALETRPAGSMAREVERIGQLSGTEAVAQTIRTFCVAAEGILTDAPKAIEAAGIDALIVDQTYAAGQTVADALKFWDIDAGAIVRRTVARSACGTRRTVLFCARWPGMAAACGTTASPQPATWSLPSAGGFATGGHGTALTIRWTMFPSNDRFFGRGASWSTSSTSCAPVPRCASMPRHLSVAHITK